MAYELTGKVKLVQDAQTFGSGGFTKRELIVTVEDGKYAQEISIEFVQDKVSLLDSVQVGQEVTITFDIRGREYGGKYYNNLVGWKIVSVCGASDSAPVAPVDDIPMGDDDDLPF